MTGIHMPKQRLWALLIVVAGVLGILCVAYLAGWLRNSRNGVLYRDSFGQNVSDEWVAYGGSWELDQGAMRNDSDEPGAKLMTGSSYWSDYVFEGDVQLFGQAGDAGLIARSSNEEEGVDAYNGYYAGLSLLRNGLLLGRADYGWAELASVPFPGGLHAYRWYHIKLIVQGSQITEMVRDNATGQSLSITKTDKHYIAQGRIGIRSHWTGGLWRNLRVTPLHDTKIPFMASFTGMLLSARHALHEAFFRDQDIDFSPNGTHYTSYDSAMLGLQNPEDDLPIKEKSSARQQTIGSLRLIFSPQRAIIRGVVTLTSPVLFVQDESGGVAIQPRKPVSLKLGDEVEVAGEVQLHTFGSVMTNAIVRPLWAYSPVPPVAVTADQAATGAFDAMFIEVDGLVRSKETGPESTLIFDLDNGQQSFRAIMNSGRGSALFRKITPGSSVRLRGICVVDSAYTHNLTPFVLLIPSIEDVQILAGPPWYSARHLLLMGLCALIFALCVYLLYLRAKHWRVCAVIEERERLAHEMHDTLAQSFAGIGFQLQAIRNRVPEQIKNLHEQLDLACDLVRHSHEEARRSISTLRPEFLESTGLHSALSACAHRMVEGGAVEIDLHTSGDGSAIPLRIKDTIFRIGLEAIANALRHANPRHLRIEVHYQLAAIDLIIEDDGSGFSVDNHSRGFGLVGMRKRAANISANMEIRSTPGCGTKVHVNAAVGPRVSLLNFPKIIWHHAKEQRLHANNSDPYSHR